MRRHTMAAAMLVVLFPATGWGETLESVEKNIAEQQAKHKTLQIKGRTTLDMNTPQMKMKQITESTLEAARKGDTWLSRTESKTTGTRKIGDSPEGKDESSTLTIFDGKVNYSLLDTGGEKSAIKMTPDRKQNLNPFDAAAWFKMQHEKYDMSLLPDDKVDGKDCYVIESKLKKADQGLIVRMVNYYRKADGIGVKAQSFNDAGKEVMSHVVTDVKVDAEIKPERFVFKAPPGIAVRDADKDRAAAEAAAKESEKSPAKTAEQPKPQEQPKKQDGVKGLLKGILK